MSDWDVQLEFSDGRSNKFWRAKADGTELTINYGRIGTNGQTKVKSLGSEEACQKELESLAKSKRRKGYDDGGSDSSSSAEPEFEKPPAGPQSADMVLEMDKRKVSLRLAVDGSTVRTEVVEHYSGTAAAESAYDRLKAAMEAEGYKPV